MKKTIITSVAFLITLMSINAQDDKEKAESGFNRWSFEINAGTNKAIQPFATGYSSSNESKLIAISVNHIDLGFRYMATTKFGLKLDLANDKFTNQSDGSSLPFETQQYRIGLQGIVNAGKIMGFEEFSKSIGIIAHAGIQVSKFTSKMGINDGISELDGGIMFGVTPQIKIFNNLVFTADFTVLSNVSQHLNWDGSRSDQSNNLTGQMYSTSLGLTYYFGKNEKHADWYIPVVIAKIDPEITKRLDTMEALMDDTDRDGIVDHLDAENNTPPGVAVDSKGRFIDVNKNGTPDELEQKVNNKDENTSIAQTDPIEMIIKKGFVNVFFDINKDQPNSGSVNSLYFIIKFLKSYPDAKVKFTGYADKSGSEQYNIDLSKRRVQNVFDLLVNAGIQPSRMSIDGAGTDKSIMYSSDASYNLARRVSIEIQ